MRQRRTLVALAMGLGLLLGITAYIAWKVDYAPDEGSHAFVIEHYAHDLEPLTWEDMRYGTERGHAYFLLSPAAYLPYLPFQWLQEALGPLESAGDPDFFYVRLAGLLIATAQYALTLLLVRRLFRAATPLQIIAIATAANLLPELRYTHAYLNPDGLTILAGTACFVVALRLLQRTRITLGDAALVGVTLGWAALMRLNVVVPAAILLLALLAALLREGGPVRERLRFAGVAVALPVLMAGSMHLAFYAELDNGDLLPADTVMMMGDSTDTGVVPPSPPMGDLIDTRLREIPTFWMTTVLWYPRFADLRGPPLRLLAALCVIGSLALAVPRGRLRTTGRIVGGAAVLGFLLTWVSIASEWLYGQQGRFLLPAGMAALAAVITGSATLVERIPRLKHGMLLTAGAWILFFLALNLWGLEVIAGGRTS